MRLAMLSTKASRQLQGGGGAVSRIIAAAGSWQASPLGVVPSVWVQLLLGEPAAELSDKVAGAK
jgi:hypothetical protein